MVVTTSIPVPSLFLTKSTTYFQTYVIISYWWIFIISVLTIYHILSPDYVHVKNFLSLSYTSVSTLDLTPSTQYLVKGGPICWVPMWFHPMKTLRNLANRDPCRDLKKCTHVLCVAVCDWHIVNFNPVLSKLKKCNGVPSVPNARLLPVFVISITLWLSWNKMFCLMSYPCAPMKKKMRCYMVP